jgi:hypothetical protein
MNRHFHRRGISRAQAAASIELFAIGHTGGDPLVLIRARDFIWARWPEFQRLNAGRNDGTALSVADQSFLALADAVCARFGAPNAG